MNFHDNDEKYIEKSQNGEKKLLSSASQTLQLHSIKNGEELFVFLINILHFSDQQCVLFGGVKRGCGGGRGGFDKDPTAREDLT